MADSSVAITPGTGANIDTRTPADGDHRQVIVLGDAETAANVAVVGATGALKVDGSAVTQPVSGTVTATGPLTDAQLRATAVTVAGNAVRGDVAAADQTGLVALAMRRDSDTVGVAADGDLSMLATDEAGRLKVASQPASYALVSMSVSAVQAAANTPVANATAFAEVSRASNVMMYVTGTFSTMNCTFESSLDSTNGTDGTWFTVQAVRSNANTVETTTGNLSALPAYAWELSVNACKYVRVRCTARTSGTQNWIIQPGTYATEPIPATQVTGTQAVSGTVTANGGTIATPTQALVMGAATANATSTKNAAGTVYGLTVSNYSAEKRYFKLFNKASAPSLGTDTPVAVFVVPADAVIAPNLGALGLRMGTGIAWALLGAAGAANAATTVCSDAGTTTVAIAYV